MSLVVSHRDLVVQAQDRSRDSQCGICGGKFGAWTSIPSRSLVFSIRKISLMFILIELLAEGHNSKAWEPWKDAFFETGCHWEEVFLHIVFCLLKY